MLHVDNIRYIVNVIDLPISKFRPNYGYIEKFGLAEQIMKLNNYLLPTDEVIIELMRIILFNGEKS